MIMKGVQILPARRPRLDWLDVAKGYGVVMVIIGHLYFPRLTPYLYTCHLPLFFFLSGYVFRTYASWSVFWRKKVRSLLVPYFAYGLVQIGFYCLYTVGPAHFHWTVLIDKLTELIVQRRFWSLWFLTCLFVTEIIYYALARLLPRQKHRLIASFLLCLLALAYYRLSGQAIAWNIDAALVALPFFALGQLYYRLHLPVCRRHQRVAWLLVVAFLIIDLACLWYNRHLGYEGLEMFRSRYYLEWLTLPGAVAGIGAVVIWSQFFTPRLVRFWGRHSLFLFACHQKVFLPVLTDLLAHVALLGPERGVLFQTVLLIAILTSMSGCILAVSSLTRRRQQA